MGRLPLHPALYVLPFFALLLAACPNVKHTFTNAYRSGLNLVDYGRPAEGTDDEGTREDEAREVLEPDVIRLDGNVLYILNQYRGLTLVDLDTLSILSRIPTYGRPRDLYLQAGRAYVLVSEAADYEVNGDTIRYSISTRLYVVDVSTPSNAHVLGEPFEMPGNLLDSRLVGDVIYAVCTEHGGAVVEESGGVSAVDVSEQTYASWVSSINVADPDHIYKADELSFEGMGNVIYATDTALFVAGSNWGWEGCGDTTITLVDISDATGVIAVHEPRMTVPGAVQDKFKMDVYDNVLRVVSGEMFWWNERTVYITTFDLSDPALPKLGETVLEGATGETLFATRFDGPRGYIVTYLVVDPLWVIDLSDPAHPAVVGELVVEGYSTYLVPQGDRLIALGVDAQNHVCCSMYDVSNPADPHLVGAPVSIGEGWSWSPAYQDVKALTVLSDVLIVPVTGWSGVRSYERLQFISYSDAGLYKRGAVDVTGGIMRSLEYAGDYYGVTGEELDRVDGADLDDPQVTARLLLAEFVADLVPLELETSAAVISRNGKIVLRTLHGETGQLDEISLELNSVREVYRYGDSLILVGVNINDGDYSSYYEIAVVDCSEPEDLAVTADFKIDVQPFWGWGPWYDVFYMERNDSLAYRGGFWWDWVPVDTSFLVGDRLVLRCSSSAYDVVIGDETPAQGLAVVDLDGFDVTVVGLGIGYVESINAAGNKLYFTEIEYPSVPSLTGIFWPTCAYFAQEFDPQSLSAGPAVNVPGAYVQYLPESDILVVRDDQWMASGNIKSRLRSLVWDGGPEIGLLLDVLDIPENRYEMLARGQDIFFTAYSEGVLLYKATVGASGILHMDDGLLVTPQWASLRDVTGGQAFLTVGDYNANQGALAVYDVSGGAEFAALHQFMGNLETIRVDESNLYLALGYGGQDIVPR